MARPQSSSSNLHRPARRVEAQEPSAPRVAHQRDTHRAALLARPVGRAILPNRPEGSTFTDSLRALRKSPLDSLQELTQTRPAPRKRKKPLPPPEPEDTHEVSKEALPSELVVTEPNEAGEDAEIWEVPEDEPMDGEPGDEPSELVATLPARFVPSSDEHMGGAVGPELGALTERVDAQLEEVRTLLENNQAALKSNSAQHDALVRDLAREVSSLGQRHVHTERKSVLLSVVSYILFCVIISGALYLVFKARMGGQEANIEAHDAQLSELDERLKLTESELRRYRQSERNAFEVFQLIEEGRHEEALALFVEVRDTLINPAEAALLREKTEALKWKLAEDAYREAYLQFRNKEYERARDGFFHSLSFKEETAFKHLLHYHLGISLFELGDHEGARRYLGLALSVENAIPEDLVEEGDFFFAVSTYKSGYRDEAYELFNRYIKRHRYTRNFAKSEKYVRRIEIERNRERRAARAANDGEDD